MIANAMRKPKVNPVAVPFKSTKKAENQDTMSKEEYLAMLDRGIKQIQEGRGIPVTNAELERMLNE